MSKIGTIESVWRYPVKSMRGEERDEIFVGFAGVYGDRLFAFRSSANRVGFPFLNAGEQRALFRCQPRFRHPEKSVAPYNLAEAERISPGATPLYPDPADLMIDIETPHGQVYAIDDPALIDLLRAGMGDQHEVTLLRSERALTDCRPLSLFSVQTVRQLAAEIGTPIDQRRFRANVYLDLTSGEGFAEDQLVHRSLRIGDKAVVSVVERDPRCSIITLDPETGEKTPAILKAVAQKHDGGAGIYAAVLIEGMVRRGDAVELLD
ncbi:MAG: MOSC domain-containing protein [Chthoniobacterales bacterium]